MQTILLTGGAGFIGFHTARALLARGDKVVLVDNLNDYYAVSLKEARLQALRDEFGDKIIFHNVDITEYEDMEPIVKEHGFTAICHLAAQAGVRYSLENPFAYTKTNVEGTLDIFELARHHKIRNVVYASSSSVYGGLKEEVFSESMQVDRPVSLYAATKKSDELMAHAYHHLYGINMTGLRFFTVYGPWGRPDMAPILFASAITEGRPIKVFNNGDMYRDFTYVTDIVDGVVAALDKQFAYQIINIGGGNPIKLLRFIELMEENLGMKAEKNMMPMQPGDVYRTSADISKARKLLGYDPKFPVEEGVRLFVEWYKDYFKV